MKSAQNKMNNSSCDTRESGTVGNSTRNSKTDSVKNQGDLKEFRNQGDLRDVTDRSGSRNRFNMTNSYS